VDLYFRRVLGLAEDLQKVVVGYEVEPWKDLSFGFQVVVQGLLDVFQSHVHCIQLIQQTYSQQRQRHVRMKTFTFQTFLSLDYGQGQGWGHG